MQHEGFRPHHIVGEFDFAIQREAVVLILHNAMQDNASENAHHACRCIICRTARVSYIAHLPIHKFGDDSSPLGTTAALPLAAADCLLLHLPQLLLHLHNTQQLALPSCPSCVSTRVSTAYLCSCTASAVLQRPSATLTIVVPAGDAVCRQRCDMCWCCVSPCRTQGRWRRTGCPPRPLPAPRHCAACTR
jgi:hypothetical protein